MKKTKKESGGVLYWIQKYGAKPHKKKYKSLFDDLLGPVVMTPKIGSVAYLFIDREWQEYEFDGKEWRPQRKD